MIIMVDYKRSLRVSELLREEISQIITQKLKDPLIGMVTVTGIKLTDDLKSARVYIGILGNVESRENSLRGLHRATNWIRNELGHRVDLKYLPAIKFIYDETFEYAENIESLLKKIKTVEEGGPTEKPSNAD